MPGVDHPHLLWQRNLPLMVSSMLGTASEQLVSIVSCSLRFFMTEIRHLQTYSKIHNQKLANQPPPPPNEELSLESQDVSLKTPLHSQREVELMDA